MSFLLIVLVMCVLVEASDESDIYKAKELWDLLACVYEANANLLELLEDRRKFHAAELIVAAWNALRSRCASQRLEQPKFLVQLEQRLATCRIRVDQDAPQASQRGSDDQIHAPRVPERMEGPFEIDFDMDLEDIDWAFWNSID